MTIEPISTENLLQTLNDSLTSASTAFPSEEELFLPPDDGISLLDVKNELLLSYLQNLVFLIILRLRQGFPGNEDEHKLKTEAAIKKLIEQRVYLERGVRPLESRLRYQIDQVLRAAEEADARQRRNGQKKSTSKQKDKEGASDASEVSSEASEVNENTGVITDLSYRPNVGQLLKRTEAPAKGSASRTNASNGAYKPPRITPTTMPALLSERPREQPRKRKSWLLDEYIEEELSTAPQAQASIGSNNTIMQRGRGTMSKGDRDKERERTEYEERNFTRLPAESKAERRKARLRSVNDRRDILGGEDWTGLGGLGDRVSRSVANRSRGEGVLERREKRHRATEDLPRGDGSQVGEAFERRKRIMQQRAEKKQRRR